MGREVNFWRLTDDLYQRRREPAGTVTIQTITQLPLHRALFTTLVLAVFAITAVEIAGEFLAGETLGEMTADLLRFVFGAALLAILSAERIAQKRELTALSGQPQRARGQLAKTDVQSVQLANQYRAVMQKQFDVWALSESEQDVVIGMLKGLSFREVAELRGTREKTVRQQASTVYRTAGVGGRNELTAWFFEDMLVSPPRADIEAWQSSARHGFQ